MLPVGSLYLAVVNTNPATSLGYGTWAAIGAGRMLVGHDIADPDFDTAEETGGTKTHTHTAHSNHITTQPSDHGALSHAGSAVGVHDAHIVTQPSAHSAHIVTQPSAHSAHVFTQPSAHSAHAGLTNNHAGAIVGNHADVTNHVHVQNTNSAATGGLVGSAPDTSTNTSVASGYSTANPTTGGVAAMVHTVGQPTAHGAIDAHSAHAGGAVDAHSSHTGSAVDAHSAHSATAVDAHSAHSVTQPSNHATQSHAGAGVDAHSVHDSPSNVPPYLVIYMFKRTA